MHEIIKQLLEDHDKILQFLDMFEKTLIQFMIEDTFHKETYSEAITFIHEFADKAHHQREEEILFHYMIEHAGSAAEKLVRQGMLVEHDLARFYVKELEQTVASYELQKRSIDKLNILSYGKSYCDLLRRHIDKENQTVFPFAERTLADELFVEMDQKNRIFHQS